MESNINVQSLFSFSFYISELNELLKYSQWLAWHVLSIVNVHTMHSAHSEILSELSVQTGWIADLNVI